MYCTRCGLPTVNGERQCRQCGAEIEGRGGTALMTAAPGRTLSLHPPQSSRLAAWFLGLSAAGLAGTFAAGIAVLMLRRWGAEVNVLSSGLALTGLCLMAVGFVSLCSALIFAALGALRLYQNPRLRGRGLLLAGAALWIAGAAIFLALRHDPHFRAPAAPLVTAPARIPPVLR